MTLTPLQCVFNLNFLKFRNLECNVEPFFKNTSIFRLKKIEAKKMLRKSCIEGREKKEEFLRLNSGNLVRPGRQVKKKSGGAGQNYISK